MLASPFHGRTFGLRKHSLQNLVISLWATEPRFKKTHIQLSEPFLPSPSASFSPKQPICCFAAPAARLGRLQGLRPAVHLLKGRQHGVARHQTPEARLLDCSAARIGDRGGFGLVPVVVFSLAKWIGRQTSKLLACH